MDNATFKTYIEDMGKLLRSLLSDERAALLNDNSLVFPPLNAQPPSVVFGTVAGVFPPVNEDKAEPGKKTSWPIAVCRKRRRKQLGKTPPVDDCMTGFPRESLARAKHVRSNKQVIFGSAADGSDLVAPRKPKERGIFITSFASSVMQSDVKKILERVSSSFICTRVSTKFTQYSSFLVLVLSEDFERVDKPEVWPSGISLL